MGGQLRMEHDYLHLYSSVDIDGDGEELQLFTNIMIAFAAEVVGDEGGLALLVIDSSSTGSWSSESMRLGSISLMSGKG